MNEAALSLALAGVALFLTSLLWLAVRMEAKSR